MEWLGVIGSTLRVRVLRQFNTDSNRARDALLPCNEAPPFTSFCNLALGRTMIFEVSASYRK